MPSSPILVEDNELDALLSKNRVDATTFAANSAVRNLHFLRDKRGNLITIATIGVNPNSSPIQAGVSGNTNSAIFDSTFTNSAQVAVADADAQSGQLVLYTKGFPMAWNGASWDRVRGSFNAYVNASDVTTTTFTSPDILTYDAKAVVLSCNVSSLTGTSGQLAIDGKDANGNYYTLALSPTFASALQETLAISPTGAAHNLGGGTTWTALTGNPALIPRTIRFRIVKNAITVWTAAYSVDVNN